MSGYEVLSRLSKVFFIISSDTLRKFNEQFRFSLKLVLMNPFHSFFGYLLSDNKEVK